MIANSTVKIQDIYACDTDTIYKIAKVCYPNAEFSEKSFGLKMLREAEITCRTALIADQVVGYCHSIETPTHMTLLQLGVDPFHRRIGVGTELFEDAIARCAATGIRHLGITICETNLVAIGFLGAMGMRAVNVIRGKFDDLDGYLFRKKLC